ncbi:MAG: methyltransferase domain-containing protein [Isosphaeraceae bacterium]
MTLHVNLELLQRMPVDARIVLDVGCGAGALADAYRRINPDARYLGIEKEAEAARIAETARRIDRVAVGDPGTILPSALGLPDAEPVVDCLVFADALEHMIDPWGVLARLSQWVRVGGQILASIPNVQHYAMLVDLLRGRWEYRSEWPPDRIDLRLFTLSGIQDLFARAGLTIFEIVPRWRPDLEFDKFQHVMAPAVRALGIDASTFAAQTRATEYLVRAVRETAEPRRMLIWSILGSAISSDVRIREPAAFLATIPGIRVLSGTGVQFDELGKTRPGEAKVFLQQRVIIPRADHLRLQRALLESGYLIVGEFDDDPGHFADLARTDFLALRGCHCLQTSTEVMAEALRPYNPHIMVFSNHVAALPPPRPANRTDLDPVTIFFGALNREADWAPILPVLNRVLSTHGDRVRVQVVYDRAFFDALTTPYKAFEPLCPYDRYKNILHSADIALLPLEPTRFNRHKSDLKFIECAAHGVVALSSPTVYDRTIRSGHTGLIYRSLDDFAAMLERLIHDGPYRRILADNAYRYVAEHRLLSRHFRARLEWYRAMLDRRGELDADLRRRVPEFS